MGLYHQEKCKWIRKIRSKVCCTRIQSNKGIRLLRNLFPYCKHPLNMHLNANGSAIWSDCPSDGCNNSLFTCDNWSWKFCRTTWRIQNKNRDDKLVYWLDKSLYGLKQSGQNWNKMLLTCLTRNDFIQNPADHCVQLKQNERIIILCWVDDLIIAADKVISLSNVKKMLMSEFKMKDLGEFDHFIVIDFDNTR